MKYYQKCGVCNKPISQEEHNKNGSDLCQDCLNDIPTNEIECICGQIVDIPEHSIVNCPCCNYELSN